MTSSPIAKCITWSSCDIFEFEPVEHSDQIRSDRRNPLLLCSASPVSNLSYRPTFSICDVSRTSVDRPKTNYMLPAAGTEHMKQTWRDLKGFDLLSLTLESCPLLSQCSLHSNSASNTIQLRRSPAETTCRFDGKRLNGLVAATSRS